MLLKFFSYFVFLIISHTSFATEVDLIACDLCSTNSVYNMPCVSPKTIRCNACGIVIEKWKKFGTRNFYLGCSTDIPSQNLISYYKGGEYRHFFNERENPVLNGLCYTPYCTREMLANLPALYDELAANFIEVCPKNCPGFCDKDGKCNVTPVCIGFYECHKFFLIYVPLIAANIILLIILCYVIYVRCGSPPAPPSLEPFESEKNVLPPNYIPWYLYDQVQKAFPMLNQGELEFPEHLPSATFIDMPEQVSAVQKKVTFEDDSQPISVSFVDNNKKTVFPVSNLDFQHENMFFKFTAYVVDGIKLKLGIISIPSSNSTEATTTTITDINFSDENAIVPQLPPPIFNTSPISADTTSYNSADS